MMMRIAVRDIYSWTRELTKDIHEIASRIMELLKKVHPD